MTKYKLTLSDKPIAFYKLKNESNYSTLSLSFGIKDVTEKLCNPQFLTDFTETNQGDKQTPFFFDTVFKIEGLEGTTLDSEIVYFNQINL